MAGHSLHRQKLLHNLTSFFCRLKTTPLPLSSSFCSSDSNSTPSSLDPTKKPDPLDPKQNDLVEHAINLANSKELFKHLSDSKLLKSSATLHIASKDGMVNIGSKVINSRLMKNPVSKKIVLDTIKRTFYDHFCGGEDLKKANVTVEELWKIGLKAMLDYGLEHAVDNESCDRNLEEFLGTIEASKTQSISFVVVKITAICPTSLLTRLSHLLRWEHKDKSLHLPWKFNTFPIFSDLSPLYHTTNTPEPLTIDEERDLYLAYQRLGKICEKSLNANVPLLIDAEDTTIQPAIDYFSYSAAIKYRTKDKSPLIFNTIQAYLKDAKERLVMAKKAADEMGVALGFKLVRGAYMVKERDLAASLGAESPIHDTIEDTHACYDGCASFMLEEVAKGSGHVVLATHNIQSGKRAAKKAMDLGIKKDNQNLHFAQLYGMAEVLSFGLKNEGFKVSKYLPFGPIEQIMPYLLRRAEENRGLLSTSAIDNELMRKEILRRFKERVSLMKKSETSGSNLIL
ncbi:Proline oxidase [Handroanthus impetiginosus]|uniref:Proline dehydrogenase n=1 Tax=Handroanthus impetiginosus TaxID=429701 RepID=A0A2G9H5K1_9LAMI|nr:Proline oxidase [Handroanthus impetiginosus]